VTGAEKSTHRALATAGVLLAKVEARATHSINDRRVKRLMEQQIEACLLWLAEFCTCTECGEIRADAGMEVAL